MNRRLRCGAIAFFLLAVILPVAAEDPSALPFTIQTISPRMLVLTEDSPMRNNLVVLASKQGLVMVDTTGSPVSARLAREAVRRQWGREDYVYVLLTHHHWDHAHGSQAFPEARVVGYQGCAASLRQDIGRSAQRIAAMEPRITELEQRLAGLDPAGPDTTGLLMQVEFQKRILQGLKEDFHPRTPQIAFNDRLTLDLGDLTVELTYFGRAHSGTDVFIRVPEEHLLITGDVFLDENWLPLFAGQNVLDVPRWIDVLNATLDGSIRTVVPAHMSLWPPERLAFWRDYIVTHWTGLQAAAAEGLNYAQVQDRFPVPASLDYLKAKGHDEAEIQHFHDNTLQRFWLQLKPSAAEAVEAELDRAGIEAASRRFAELRADPKESYVINEAQFNALGYRLLGRSRIAEAIAVFQMNAEAFPSSANAYDSLGEALMQGGNREEAIRNYRKSLELNPNNSNAVEMLRRLGVENPNPEPSEGSPPPPPARSTAPSRAPERVTPAGG